MLPPKIGDGVFGSSVGAVQAFGASFFGAAAASSALTTKERLAGRAQTLARALLSLALTVRACIFLRLVIDDDTMYKVRGNANGAWREGEGPDRGGDLASTSASPGGPPQRSPRSDISSIRLDWIRAWLVVITRPLRSPAPPPPPTQNPQPPPRTRHRRPSRRASPSPKTAAARAYASVPPRPPSPSPL